MKHIALLGLTLATLLASCKKDDTTTTTTSANTSLLINKRWGVTAVTSQQTGSSVTFDAYAQMDDCEQDNYLRFNSDHSAEANEGPLKCYSGDPQSQTGNWELLANDSKLLLTTPLFGSGAAALLDIVTLTDSRMVLRGTLIDNGVTATYTATLTPY
jgi:hypothetical protein